jgi:hypothetical protein
LTGHTIRAATFPGTESIRDYLSGRLRVEFVADATSKNISLIVVLRKAMLSVDLSAKLSDTTVSGVVCKLSCMNDQVVQP